MQAEDHLRRAVVLLVESSCYDEAVRLTESLLAVRDACRQQASLVAQAEGWARINVGSGI